MGKVDWKFVRNLVFWPIKGWPSLFGPGIRDEGYRFFSFMCGLIFGTVSTAVFHILEMYWVPLLFITISYLFGGVIYYLRNYTSKRKLVYVYIFNYVLGFVATVMVVVHWIISFLRMIHFLY